ncbi:hypothetical protein DSLASN_08680 [Desulfoluna limicola]|uniref:Uncharacterized protein n=1 Tax=Desulfoluna limicola TaxID=2810562 RepID=A0ABN6F0Z5_9BACT|nr:hypothetical protein DSLASN_08680 [Desulfoluna limicola]
MCGRTGLKAPHAVVDGALRDELLAGPNASSAQDALGEITNDKRVRLVKGAVVGHGVEIRLPDPEFSRNPPQLAPVPLAADDTGLRMFGDHQPDEIPPVPQNPLCVRQDAHPVSDRGDA